MWNFKNKMHIKVSTLLQSAVKLLSLIVSVFHLLFLIDFKKDYIFADMYKFVCVYMYIRSDFSHRLNLSTFFNTFYQIWKKFIHLVCLSAFACFIFVNILWIFWNWYMLFRFAVEWHKWTLHKCLPLNE